jgi:hypothetical protein
LGLKEKMVKISFKKIFFKNIFSENERVDTS